MSSAVSDVPKGKVACLLCRGFISYKDSDRTRFKDHMLNEHDVKYDSDVVLATSVMTEKEKAFIVKSALKRLSEISNNQVPSSGESILPSTIEPTSMHHQPAPAQIQSHGNAKPGNPRGRPPVVTGVRPENPHPSQSIQGALLRTTSPYIGRPSKQQVPRQHHAQLQKMPRSSPVTGLSRAPVPLVQQLPPNFPRHLGVSISRIDPSVNCDICKIVLPNKEALASHTQTEHLSRFTGLALVMASSSTGTGHKRQSLPEPGYSSNMVPVRPPPSLAMQIPSKRPRTVETPVNFRKLGLESPGNNIGPSMNFSPQLNRKMQRRPQSAQPNRLPNVSNSTTKSHHLPPKLLSSPRQATPLTKSSVLSPVTRQSTASPLPVREPSEPDPVIKCNTCGLFVKQSLFKSHKLAHPKEERVMPSLKEEKAKQFVNVPDSELNSREREEKLIDFVDLGDSDEEYDRISTKYEKKYIACQSCDKKLSSNMALKMHMNLKHPVKTELYDTEELLAEETDEKTKKESQGKIRNEVESMETLELLDNLVNFLNDT